MSRALVASRAQEGALLVEGDRIYVGARFRRAEGAGACWNIKEGDVIRLTGAPYRGWWSFCHEDEHPWVPGILSTTTESLLDSSVWTPV